MAKTFPLRANNKSKRKRSTGRVWGVKAVPLSQKAGELARAAERQKLMDLRAATNAPLISKSRLEVNSRTLKMPDLTILDLPKILGIWRNAVRLAAKADSYDNARGELAISLIEQEWKRRGVGALNSKDYFRWPDTSAAKGYGDFDLGAAPAEGVLGYLEYRVGRTRGEAPGVRRVILRRVFEGELPPVFPREYLGEWGEKSTAARLQKLAESIASFCRNA
jgi:hypothetical protein